MFSQSSGPTALRVDLVRWLALSLQEARLRTAEGMRWAHCGVAGVWNDSKGAVVLVVKQLDPPRVDRYAYAEPILTLAELEQVFDLGLGFAENMGFLMDSPEFAGLPGERQTERLARWNLIRKVRPGDAAEAGRRDAGQPTAEPPAEPSESETAAIELVELAPAEPDADAAAAPTRAVLGRIKLVQRAEGERAMPKLPGRLRSYF